MVPHHHQGLLRQRQALLGGQFAGAPGGQHQGPAARGPGHRQGHLQGVGPGLVGDRPDHPSGPQNREAADNPQPLVEGPARALRAVGDRDGHLKGLAPGEAGEDRSDRFKDHPSRHRVDRRLSHRNRQPGLGDPADAPATANDYLDRGARPDSPRFGRAGTGRCPGLLCEGHLGMDLDPVGDVRVVAGILDHEAAGPLPGKNLATQLKTGGEAGREIDFNLLDAALVAQHQGRPLGGGGGAGPGREAVAKFFCRHLRPWR